MGSFFNETTEQAREGSRWLCITLKASGGYSFDGRAVGSFKIKDETNTASSAYAAALEHGADAVEPKFMPEASYFLGNPDLIEFLFMVPATSHQFTLEAPDSKPVPVSLKVSGKRK
jgi:hypothetical protein